jgi:hypothetical protein
MRCLVATGKHVNDMRAIARRPPIATKKTIGGGVFCWVRPESIAQIPGRLSEFSSRIFAGHYSLVDPLPGNDY